VLVGTKSPICGGVRFGGVVNVTRTTWKRIAQLVAEFLPAARITHPWPHGRLTVKHPRWKPGA
jgi:hypothetical protein